MWNCTAKYTDESMEVDSLFSTTSQKNAHRVILMQFSFHLIQYCDSFKTFVAWMSWIMYITAVYQIVREKNPKHLISRCLSC